jgi:hypothetical protein
MRDLLDNTDCIVLCEFSHLLEDVFKCVDLESVTLTLLVLTCIGIGLLFRLGQEGHFFVVFVICEHRAIL